LDLHSKNSMGNYVLLGCYAAVTRKQLQTLFEEHGASL